MNFFENNASTLRHTQFFGIELIPGTIVDTNGAHEGLGERFLAGLLVVALSPLLLVCALAVRLTSRGPALYSQPRLGRGGKVFSIFKFRSMVADAEAKTGPVLSQRNDPRVTWVGRLLRNTHLDELPQLFNVVRGEMSFIGPRPERPELARAISSEVPRFSWRTAVNPGITGLAQICGEYDTAPEKKLEFDLLYIKHKASLKLNLFILYNTVRKMLLIRFNV